MQTEAKKRQNMIGLGVLVIVIIIAAVISNNRTIEARKNHYKQMKEAQKAAEHAMEQGFHHPASKFKIPENSGPTDAPVKVVCYIDSSNECLKFNIDALEKLQAVYGDLVSIEYRDTLFEEMLKASDELQIGCDAGIYINDEIERQTIPDNKDSIADFRGAIDADHFWTCDMYGAINIILDGENIEVPTEARKLSIRPDNYPAR